MPRVLAKDVDGYIAQFAPAVRAELQKIRRTIRAAAPDAQEMISYGIPAYKQQGIVVYFAAFKQHIGLYPPVRGDQRLMRATARYAGPKGNLKFALDAPIPYALIGRIVKLRIKQNLAKASAKK